MHSAVPKAQPRWRVSFAWMGLAPAMVTAWRATHCVRPMAVPYVLCGLLHPASCERAERSFCGAAACFAVMLRDAQCLGCSGSLPWLSASRAERRWLTEVHLRVKRHRRVLTGYSLLWGTHGVLSHRGSWLTEGHLRVERHWRVQPKRLVHDAAEQSRAGTDRSACSAPPRWRMFTRKDFRFPQRGGV